MSVSLYFLVFLSLVCGVRACYSDYDCSSPQYCYIFPLQTSGTCKSPGGFGDACNSNTASRKQCISGYYCLVVGGSTNGQCASCSGTTCSNSPNVDGAVGAAAIAFTTIVLISTITPVVICIVICVCCYYCNRRPVIIANSQPSVVVTSVGMNNTMPMQQPVMAVPATAPYYMPPQQPQYIQSYPQQPYPQQPWQQPQQQPPAYAVGNNPYQPLSYETQQTEGTPYVPPVTTNTQI